MLHISLKIRALTVNRTQGLKIFSLTLSQLSYQSSNPWIDNITYRKGEGDSDSFLRLHTVQYLSKMMRKLYITSMMNDAPLQMLHTRKNTYTHPWESLRLVDLSGVTYHYPSVVRAPTKSLLVLFFLTYSFFYYTHKNITHTYHTSHIFQP